MRLIYIHGISVVEPKDTLKKQWDDALFGSGNNAKKACTRLAYWSTAATRALYKLLSMATFMQSKLAKDLEAQMLDNINKNSKKLGGPVVKVLPRPLGGMVLAWIAAVLPDLEKFLYQPKERKRMCETLERELLSAKEEEQEIIVVGHSQGSMIAYEVLSRSKIPVKLFITIGSPLGLEEIKDELKKWHRVKKGKELKRPACVKRWVNLANRFDFVALDASLRDDFDPKGFVKDFVEFWLSGVHDAARYLSTGVLRKEVQSAW